MIKDPEKSATQAKSLKEANKSLMDQLHQNQRDLDATFDRHHEEVFAITDCLECANCCKTTSPIFLQEDIDRIASYLKMKPGAFIIEYLEMDEEGDFVLRQAPCSFLNADNTCKVYDVRPNACREYPHTNRKNMHEILDLTLENSIVCPAVNEILKRIKLEN
ncbi:MAG: zinc/iron-chelating domain-containing protein [Crocinitomicaceae bacterium]|nr:zinc/iron-chelating domain-containing protein [Crocinitomicaceae bacterium]|tara:strand:+ start:4164 stop:4649 length:486 start_codon:yes stop_codon:yes gene_type:complete